MVRSSRTILLILSPEGMSPDSEKGTTATGMAESAPSVIRISNSALAGLPAMVTTSINSHAIATLGSLVPVIVRFVICVPIVLISTAGG